MFDIKLTDTGDLDLENMSFKDPFRLTFCLAEYKSQRVTFLSAPYNVPLKKNDGQKISFSFISNLDDELKQDKPVEDNEELIQAMRIAFRTEQGDILDDTVGTDFYHNFHSMIRSDADLEKIADEAAIIVADYFPDAETRISYKIAPEAENFKFQAVTITVVDENNKVLTKFVF